MVRNCLQTSRPSISGNIKSSTTASKSVAASRSSAVPPSDATATLNPAWPRYSDSISARRGSSSTNRMRSTIAPATLPHYRVSPSMRHFVHLLQVSSQRVTLGWSEHLAYVANELHDALGGLVGKLQM